MHFQNYFFVAPSFSILTTECKHQISEAIRKKTQSGALRLSQVSHRWKANFLVLFVSRKTIFVNFTPKIHEKVSFQNTRGWCKNPNHISEHNQSLHDMIIYFLFVTDLILTACGTSLKNFSSNLASCCISIGLSIVLASLWYPAEMLLTSPRFSGNLLRRMWRWCVSLCSSYSLVLTSWWEAPPAPLYNCQLSYCQGIY